MAINDKKLGHLWKSFYISEKRKLVGSKYIMPIQVELSVKERERIHLYLFHTCEMTRLNKFLIPAREPYCNGEKCPGTGSPRGFNGKQISLALGKFDIDDTSDPIISNLPYRLTRKQDMVLTSNNEISSPQFDQQELKTHFRSLIYTSQPEFPRDR